MKCIIICIIIVCQSETKGKQCLMVNLVLYTVLEKHHGENTFFVSFFISNSFIFVHAHILDAHLVNDISDHKWQSGLDDPLRSLSTKTLL